MADLDRYRRMSVGLPGAVADLESAVVSGLLADLADGTLSAIETQIRVLANNLANANTVGFKRSRVIFESLPSDVQREPGPPNGLQEEMPHGIQVGQGVRVSGTQLDFRPGRLRPTNRPLDLAIEGAGFFQVQTIHSGKEATAYTRAGNFVLNQQSEIVLANSAGSRLEPPISVPTDFERLTVGQEGKIFVIQQGDPQPHAIGQTELARFVNPEGLLQIGKNLFIESEASGPPITAAAMEDGLGEIMQSHLESSNVELAREQAELWLAQRTFELHSRFLLSKMHDERGATTSPTSATLPGSSLSMNSPR